MTPINPNDQIHVLQPRKASAVRNDTTGSQGVGFEAQSEIDKSKARVDPVPVKQVTPGTTHISPVNSPIIIGSKANSRAVSPVIAAAVNGEDL